MKKLLFVFYLLAFFLSAMCAQQPDFTCVGFAAMNGGTTGGQGGTEVTVTNLAQFKQYVSEKDVTPRIIYVKGVLEGAGGGEVVTIGSNKTIIGIGDQAQVLKVQFYCKNAKNLIFRNLFFSMAGSTLGSDADCISIATTSSNKCQNIWIDHCTFDNKVSLVSNPSASVKDQYDGLLDIKKNTEYITVSWCVFKNHYKGILVGYTATDTYDRKITMHHNAFINVGSRTPSYRGGTAHIYNNYWEGAYDSAAQKYFSTGVNTREEATLFVESNYFKNMSQTVYCALADVKKEGSAYYRNNAFENSPAETAPTCDAFVLPYTAVVDDATSLPETIMQYAGVNVLEDPSNIPLPEEGGETPSALPAPYLKEAKNISPVGFELEWDAVEAATQYIVNISNEEQVEGAVDVFKETFNNLTTSVTKNALASGATDNPSAKYNATGGGSGMACLENGAMDLNAGRFSILDLDLSEASTLYLKCKYVSGAGKLLVHVDYVGTSGTGAIYNSAASSIGSEYVTLSIPLAIATANSTIQIRTEGSTVVRIDDILITNGGSGSKTNTVSYTVNAPATSLSISGLNSETEYTVEVIAKNDSETSGSSNAVYATTLETGVSVENETTDKEAVKYIASVVGSDIVFKAAGLYNIYNFAGQLLKYGESTSDYHTVPANLPEGIYVVVLNGQSQKIAIR